MDVPSSERAGDLYITVRKKLAPGIVFLWPGFFARPGFLSSQN